MNSCFLNAALDKCHLFTRSAAASDGERRRPAQLRHAANLQCKPDFAAQGIGPAQNVLEHASAQRAQNTVMLRVGNSSGAPLSRKMWVARVAFRTRVGVVLNVMDPCYEMPARHSESFECRRRCFLSMVVCSVRTLTACWPSFCILRSVFQRYV